MKKLVAFALDWRTFTYFFAALLVVGGVGAYFSLGKLEDPDFTVKTAVILTPYPGASPKEVEEEITDKIEGALQEMPQLRFLTSYSRAGSSLIKVEIKQEYWADRLPQVWDEMRRKVNDVSGNLPPGASKPIVMDDFSFVYGFVMAVTGDGFSYAEIEEHAKAIQKELNLVDGVARVELWGQQPKVIYVDVQEKVLAELGLTTEVLLANLATQNLVVDPGAIELQGQRYRFEVTGDFTSIEQIENLPVRASILDTALNAAGAAAGGRPINERSSDLIRVKDVGTVRRGYLEPPMNMMRFQGQPALGISVATVAGGDITGTGKAIAAKLDELSGELPIGIHVDRIAWQGDLVEKAVGGFIINLLESVLIVLVVITVGMGWRIGVIVGSGLVITILGTLMALVFVGVDLHRVSLGSFVIALGMLVDNGIVVADGVAQRLKRGMDRRKAAVEAAANPAIALLGATLVAVAAFYPSIASKTDGGEYGRTLFIVVGISLLLSWLIAMTVTPLQCMDLLPEPEGDDSSKGEEAGQSGLLGVFRRFLETAIRLRLLTVACLLALFACALLGFQKVDRAFFTDSTRTQFMIDYWAPEGTKIQQVADDLKAIEDKLLADGDRVLNVSTFIGGGPPRFYLPVDPEFPYQSYAQIIVNTKDLKAVTPLFNEMDAWMKKTQPQALTRARKFTAGPGFTWPLEARFSGPANADREVLRGLAKQGEAILAKSAYAKDIRTDMRQPVQKVVTKYDDDRARWTVVSRVNVASALRAAYDGLPVGLYREGDDLQPIFVRFREEERMRLSESLDTLQVRPALSTQSVPLASVVEGVDLEWEDPILVRWNRRPAVTVQAAPAGVSFPTLHNDVREAFEAIELPPGYQLEWRGEYFGTLDSQLALIPGIILAVVTMLFLMVALFNSVRIPIMIFLVVPLGIIGITAGLLATNNPFSFMALIGGLSLVGMMVKNSIVLVDEIRLNESSGIDRYDSVIQAAISRAGPITLGAATTILGVAPLLQDIFWVAMSVTIMAGLTLGTVFTLIVIPVAYTIFFGIEAPGKAGKKDTGKEDAEPSEGG